MNHYNGDIHGPPLLPGRVAAVVPGRRGNAGRIEGGSVSPLDAGDRTGCAWTGCAAYEEVQMPGLGGDLGRCGIAHDRDGRAGSIGPLDRTAANLEIQGLGRRQGSAWTGEHDPAKAIVPLPHHHGGRALDGEAAQAGRMERGGVGVDGAGRLGDDGEQQENQDQGEADWGYDVTSSVG